MLTGRKITLMHCMPHSLCTSLISTQTTYPCITPIVPFPFFGSQYPLEVKLPAVREDPRADRAQYRLWVHTSDVRFAGTDAGIVMEILGDRGTSGRHPMTGDGTKDLFERAQVNVAGWRLMMWYD